MLKRLLIVLTLMSAAACAPMTSERPLFTAASQAGPPPLREGLWIMVSEDCPARLAARRRPPLKCIPSTLSRAADGAWLLHMRGPPEEGQHAPQEADLSLVIVPGVERALGEAYAPLYVVQYRDPGHDGPGPLRYAALVPLGPMPSEDVSVQEIECGDALRDGPIRGVTAVHDADGRLTGCIASRPAAVREAARRMIIENEPGQGQRFVFVRPDLTRQNPAPHAP